MSKRDLSELRLSERQQVLLSRFHDGECSCLQSWLAKRLISRNPDAQAFLHQLTDLKDCCVEFVNCQTPHATTEASTEASGGEGIDFCNRVMARIEQEARAELYLGKRRVEQPQVSLWERLTSRHSLAGGLSGAAVAATVLAVLYQPSTINTFRAPVSVASNNPLQLVRPVAIESGVNRLAGLPSTLPRVVTHRPLEVDWVRSQGSLKLIPDSSGSSAIIWISRKVPAIAQAVLTPSVARSVTSKQATVGSGGMLRNTLGKRGKTYP
jgi:hypothetical protein